MKQRIRESVSQGGSRPTPPQGESKFWAKAQEVRFLAEAQESETNEGINNDLSLMNNIQQVYDDISSTREALWEQAREDTELYEVLYSTHAAWFTRTLTYLHIHREMIYHKWNIEETCDRFPGVDRGIIELIRDCPRPEWLGTIGVEPDISAQAYLFVGLLKRRLDTPYPGEENSNTGPILHDLARSINEAFLAEFDYEKAYEWSELMWRMLSGQKMLDGDDIMGEIFSVLGIDATLLKADPSKLQDDSDRPSVQDLSKAFIKKFVDLGDFDEANAERARLDAAARVRQVNIEELLKKSSQNDQSGESQDDSDSGAPQDDSDSSEPQDDGDTNNGGILDSLFGFFGNEAPPVLSDPR